MNHDDLLALARESGKSIKSAADLTDLRQQLMKATIEAALNAELAYHLDSAETCAPNSRNGYSSKRLQTEDGEFELATPRKRSGDFKPQLVKKHRRRFTTMDDKILQLYAQGLSTRDIVKIFHDMYGAEI